MALDGPPVGALGVPPCAFTGPTHGGLVLKTILTWIMPSRRRSRRLRAAAAWQREERQAAFRRLAELARTDDRPARTLW